MEDGLSTGNPHQPLVGRGPETLSFYQEFAVLRFDAGERPRVHEPQPNTSRQLRWYPLRRAHPRGGGAPVRSIAALSICHELGFEVRLHLRQSWVFLLIA